MSFFNGTVIDQIYIVYGLIALVLVLILILVILDRREKKKRSKSFIEPVLKKEKEKEEVTSPVTTNVEIPIIEPVEPASPIASIKEDNTPNEVVDETLDTVEEDSDLEKTQAQIEIQQLTKVLEKAEEEDDKIKLTHFEQEQEANAIISINELMKKSNDLYQKNETVQYMDEGNEPINLEELKAKYEQESTPVEETPSVSVTKEKLPDFATEKELATAKENNRKPSKFKSSPIISPVYGIEKGTESTPRKEPPIELENTADLDQLDDEIRKTNEFLRILKELKKNLQ